MTSANRFSLAGQSALVIGGTSGIGKAIAIGYLQTGSHVVDAGRSRDKLEQAVRELGAHGEVFGFQADVSDVAGLRGLIGATLASHRGWPGSALYAIAKSGVLSPARCTTLYAI